MMDKNKIKGMVSHILHPQKNKDIDHKIMHVEREWFLGIFLGTVVVAVGMMWSWFSYQEYRTIDTLKSEGVDDSFVYKEELVREVLKDFEQREVVYETLLNEAADKILMTPVSTSSSKTDNYDEEEESGEDASETDYVNPMIGNGQNGEVLHFR